MGDSQGNPGEERKRRLKKSNGKEGRPKQPCKFESEKKKKNRKKPGEKKRGKTFSHKKLWMKGDPESSRKKKGRTSQKRSKKKQQGRKGPQLRKYI